MNECKDCVHSDIYDWEQDIKTGRATPFYFCEKRLEDCKNVTECEYLDTCEELRGKAE